MQDWNLPLSEDDVIEQAKSRIVWAYKHTGFMKQYRKVLKRKSRVVGRSTRRNGHKIWLDYARHWHAADRIINRTGVSNGYDNSMGTLCITMPTQAATDIGTAKYAAIAIAKWMPRVSILHGVPWRGWKNGSNSDEAVADLKKVIRRDLREVGAWDDTELEDDEMNVVRAVWLAGCSLHENSYD